MPAWSGLGHQLWVIISTNMVSGLEQELPLEIDKSVVPKIKIRAKKGKITIIPEVLTRQPHKPRDFFCAPHGCMVRTRDLIPRGSNPRSHASYVHRLTTPPINTLVFIGDIRSPRSIFIRF